MSIHQDQNMQEQSFDPSLAASAPSLEQYEAMYREVSRLGAALASATTTADNAAATATAAITAGTTSSQTGMPRVVDNFGSLKVKEPETFDGSYDSTRIKIRNFISQCELQFLLRAKAFSLESSKVLYACAHLRGEAYQWVETYLQATEEQRASETMEWFQTWKSFKEKLEQIYGDPDFAASCARKIVALRSTGSVQAYTADFRRLAFHLEWHDDAFRHHYYEGLQDRIKDTMMILDAPKTFEEMVIMAERIGTRQYVRQQQRGTSTNSHNHKHHNERSSSSYNTVPRQSNPSSSASNKLPDDGGVRPMEVDASRQSAQPVRKGPLSDAEKAYRRLHNLCLYCGKTGHVANDCPAKRPTTYPKPVRTNATHRLVISSPNNIPLGSPNDGAQ